MGLAQSRCRSARRRNTASSARMALKGYCGTGAAIWHLPAVLAIDGIDDRIAIPANHRVSVFLECIREFTALVAMLPYAHDAHALLGGVLDLPVNPFAVFCLRRHVADEGSCPLDQWSERSEEHTSELQSLMLISYADF